MKTNIIYLIVILIIILVGMGVWLKINNTPTPDVNTPGRYMDIESYVKNDISTLSPVKEQLGGTFYVTAIETNNGTGVVSYEDGHNAYTADFTYTIADDGKPTITNFTIR
ncbi:MAG: hypothetical protein KBC48_00370 [Candidatus Pacebacteria bacterium]|nr:hypothetical protein [Candidatus Paceibacterota bacterium]